MKKHVLLLLLFVILCSFSACSKTKQIKEPTFESNKEYSGFGDIPNNYTPQQAKKDDCFVIVTDNEGDTEPEVYGEDQWQSYLENSDKGEEAFLRVAHFIGRDGYYQDLYYHEDKHYLYTKEENGIRSEGPFHYLRTLVGHDGIPLKEVTRYVLTDSLELTCHDVLWAYYSSNSESVTKTPFVWLLFTIYLNNVADSSTMSQD